MRRIRILVAYDGTEFHGWQVQPNVPTIQGWLEKVVSEIEGAPVKVHGSGRTDAGVHALGQVAAFSICNRIPCPNLRKAMNRLLPPAIRVLEVAEAPADFHPRYHARSKTYEYRIWRDEVCPPMRRLYLCHFPYPLDEARMIELAPLFEGEHDFTAFAAADERDALGGSKVRTIFESRLWREGSELVYRVRGSGFLKHMVRMMVGTLVEAGKGNLALEDIQARLAPGFPGKAGPAMPASGLCLLSVEYGS
jgi:tRNA pseudouridine38-40 synthase